MSEQSGMLIVSYPEQTVGGQLIDTLVNQEIQRREDRKFNELKMKYDAAKAQIDIRSKREREYWNDMIESAEEMYGTNPNYGFIARLWWIIIGLFVLYVIEPIERGN